MCARHLKYLSSNDESRKATLKLGQDEIFEKGQVVGLRCESHAMTKKQVAPLGKEKNKLINYCSI